MDRLLLRLKEEVAMDGYRGTSISEMWEYIKEFIKENNELDKDLEPIVDMSYKNYFWSNLQYMKELSFFSEDQLPAIEEQKKKNAEAEIDVDPEYEYIENILEQKYEEVYKTYGEKLRILASKQLQEAQLYIGIPSTAKFSPQQLNLLTTILHARKNGITQANLTAVWGLDPRSTGHYVKVLEQKGGIQRAMVCINNIRTNLCVHARFKTDDPIVTNDDSDIKPSNLNKMGVIYTPKVFEDTMVNLLTNAKDNIMPALDILSAMGFELTTRRVKSWFNRVSEKLCDKGVIRKMAARANDSQLRVRCFQLIVRNEDDPIKPIKYEDPDNKNYDKNIPFEDLTPFVLKSKKSTENQRLLCFITLERQMMDIIYNSGEKGIVQKDIGSIINSDNRRSVSNKLDKLVTLADVAQIHYGINRALEFDRKKRLYRYYSYVNYVKVVEQKTLDIPVYKPFMFPETKFELINFRTAQPITGKRRKAARRITKPIGSESENINKDKNKANSKKNSTIAKPNNTKNNNNNNEINNLKKAKINSSSPSSTTTTSSPATTSTAASKSISPNSVTKEPAPLASIFVRKRPTIIKASNNESSKENNNYSQSESSDEPPAKRQMTKNNKPSENNKDNENNKDVTLENSPNNDEALQIDSNVNNTNEESIKRPRDESSSTPTIATTRAKRSCRTKSANSIASYFHKINFNKSTDSKRNDKENENIPNSESSSLSTNNNSNLSVDKNQKDPTIVSDQPIENDNNEHESEKKSASTSSEVLANNKHKALISCTVPVVSLPPVTIQKSLSSTISKNRKFNPRNTHHALQVNTYMERRKNVILAALEEKHIIERGLELKQLYEKKKTEMYGSDSETGSPFIDSKTLWRTIVELEKDKKLSTYTGNTKLLNGTLVPKTIVLHHSIEADGKEIKDYFKYLNEKKLLQPHISKMKTLEKTNLIVERLHDRIERLQQNKNDALASNNVLEAKRIENDMNILLTNADESTLVPAPYYKGTVINNQLVLASQFGFINSRLIRTKLFHEYLYGILPKDESGFDNQESVTILSSKIIQELTLGISCKIVGVFFPNEEFKAFLKNEENYEIKLVDLSENLRTVVFQSANKFRWRLRSLFDLLQFLGILEPVNDVSEFPSSFKLQPKETSTKSSSNLALAYRIHKRTNILNYRLPDYPIVKEALIDNPANILLFWSDLQYLSTTYSADEGESEVPIIRSPSDGPHIRALHTLKNWSTNYVYSYEQRLVLNKYVDVVNRTTPMNNTALCKTIAEELDSTTDIIRSYYRRVQSTMVRQYRRKKLAQQNKVPNLTVKTRRSRINYSTKANKAISLSTTDPFKTSKKLSAAEKLAIKQNKKKSSSSKSYLDDDEVIPQMEISEVRTRLIAKRKPRKIWNSEDEELLKIIYVILKHRSEFGHRLLWHFARIILPDYSIPQMRRRIQSLKEKPDEQEQIQNTQIKWRFYYNHGVKNNEIKAWKYVSDQDFNLTTFLTYYLTQEQTSNVTGANLFFPELPYSAKYIDSNYNIQITQNNHITRNNIYFEDDFQQCHTSNGMLLTLVSNAFSLRTFEDSTYDAPFIPTEDVFENRTLEQIIAFFKMIIFTPVELYDPYYSFAIIKSYPEAIFKSAIQYLRDDGLLVRVKGNRSHDRRIPSTLFGISEKYMRMMSTTLPKRFFDKACDYENYIIKEKNVDVVPIDLNGGMMGCLLDMFSEGKISLNFQTNNNINNENLIPSYDGRRLREIQVEYDVGIELINGHQTTSNKNITIDNLQKLQQITFDQLHIQLTGWRALNNDGRTYNLIKKIVDYLSLVGQNGATLPNILQHINEKKKPNLIVGNKQFLECINIMAYQMTPPIIAFVGYRDPFIVLTTELNSWAIFPPQIIVNTPRTQVKVPKRKRKTTQTSDEKGTEPAPPSNNEVDKIPIERSKTIIPRIWRDVNGNLTKSVWNGCVNTLFETIFQRPGITLGQLCRIYYSAMTLMEIKDILDHMIAQGILRKVCIFTDIKIPSTKSRLFSKKVPLQVSTNGATVNHHTQTSYWVESGYYNHIS